MQKIDEVKRPVKIGEYFIVPCIVREGESKLFVTPVINLPHSDRENGQNDVHYHADFRFIKENSDGGVLNRHSKYHFCENVRPKDKIDGEIEYFALPVIKEDFLGITPVELISKSTLKHKCIHKGKCPHRGYDLSQVKAVGGVITCPLHGLKFSEDSGKVLNFGENKN